MIRRLLHGWEEKVHEGTVERIVHRGDVTDLLSSFGRDQSFLRDLLHRLRRIGNYEAIHRATSLEHLRAVLVLYAREDWTEEDKFVATSNYLEHGKSQYLS